MKEKNCGSGSHGGGLPRRLRHSQSLPAARDHYGHGCRWPHDVQEASLGTLPNDSDTDDDGLTDGVNGPRDG